jgi:hypothetical protein
MEDSKLRTHDIILSAAIGAVLGKLQAESLRDTATGLAALHDGERRILRAVAGGAYSVAHLHKIAARKAEFNGGDNVSVLPDKFAALILTLAEQGLCADEGSAHLQPPYAALLSSWLSEEGALAVGVEGDRIDLAKITRHQLVFIWEHQQDVGHLMAKVSTVVLESLARNRVGVKEDGGSVRPPASAEEFYRTPALKGIVELARAGRLEGKNSKLVAYDLSNALNTALKTAPSGVQFKAMMGSEILLAFRHVEAHAWTRLPQLTRNGLTVAVVDAAVLAAVAVLSARDDCCFDTDSDGWLRCTGGGPV